MVVVHDLMQVVFPLVYVFQLDVSGQGGLYALLPLVDALDAVDGEDPEVVDPLLEEFVQLGHRQLLPLPLPNDLANLLQTSLPRLDGGHHLLHQGRLLGHLRKLVLYVLQNLHGVVLPVENLGHDLHVALGDVLLVPEFLQIGESLVDGLFLPLLVSAVVGLVSHFVWVSGGVLLSREG